MRLSVALCGRPQQAIDKAARRRHVRSNRESDTVRSTRSPLDQPADGTSAGHDKYKFYKTRAGKFLRNEQRRNSSRQRTEYRSDNQTGQSPKPKPYQYCPVDTWHQHAVAAPAVQAKRATAVGRACPRTK